MVEWCLLVAAGILSIAPVIPGSAKFLPVADTSLLAGCLFVAAVLMAMFRGELIRGLIMLAAGIGFTVLLAKLT